MRESTVTFSWSMLIGDCTLKVVRVWSHVSFQVRILVLHPTLHREPKAIPLELLKYSSKCKMHVGEFFALKKEELGKYFDLRTSNKSECGLWIIRQHWRTRRAALKALDPENPIFLPTTWSKQASSNLSNEFSFCLVFAPTSSY